MDRITELTERGLENLTPDELGELFDLLNEAWAEARDAEVSAETVATLSELRDRLAAVRAENERRTEAAAEIEAQRQALIDEVEAPEPEPVVAETPEENGDESGNDDGETEEGEQPTEATPAAQPVAETETPAEQPIAAAAPPATPPPIRSFAARRPANLAPRARAGADPTGLVITAAGDVPGFSAGRPMTFEDMGRAFADKAEALRRSGPGASASVATIRANPGAPLAGQPGVDTTALIASAQAEHRQALTAAGGFCAPAQPLYTFQQIAVADRPVRGALARIPSSRGRVTVMPPWKLADTSDGMVVWTAENDATPSAPTTKPCVELDCGTPVTVNVDAIPLCVTVGNFDRITFPENFANFWEVAQAQHARLAERNLLDGIDANSVAITDGSLMGATREVLSTLGRVAAIQRNAFRMARNATVQVIAPMWLLAAMREDLTRQHPGDNAIALADSVIEGYFRADNLSVTWSMEGRTGAGQDFVDQPAGALQGYPANVEFQIFHPDAHFLLELPELNLGTEIRDSTLNAENSVQAWMEIFEGVGFNGLWSKRLTLAVCFDGDSNSGNPYDCADVATGS